MQQLIRLLANNGVECVVTDYSVLLSLSGVSSSSGSINYKQFHLQSEKQARTGKMMRHFSRCHFFFESDVKSP